MIDEIKSYYQKRGLKEPTALEALMWLISEVGELVDACCQTPDAISGVGLQLDIYLSVLIDQCRVIERTVAEQSGWVRNNQPKGTYDLPGEVGDVLMMLSVFAEKAGLPEPEVCLREKMERKLRDVQR